MIYLVADHRGYKLKEQVKEYLKEQKIAFIDGGANNEERSDVEAYVRDQVKYMYAHPKAKGIAICGTAMGATLQANRFKKIRGVACYNQAMVVRAIEHNYMNILCMGSEYTKIDEAKKMINAFLTTKPLPGRYLVRTNMLDEDL